MTIKFLTSILIFLICNSTFANNKFNLMIELGSVWQNRNDTQIDPTTGTRVAIDELENSSIFHHRVEAYYFFNKKHALRLVYAPLNLNVTGQTGSSLIFNGETFDGTQNFDVRYKFNSYRATYIYSFTGFGKNQINLGVTAKVRDALTTFSQNGVSKSYDNLGFVPLIYFEYQHEIRPKWLINLTLDGAIASQGRALDMALKVRRNIAENASLGLGFRSLEGGADNDKVYTFSWFTYAIADVVFVF